MQLLRQVAPVAAIVDGYLTGNHLPPAFAAFGVDVVHVQSTPEFVAGMSPPNLSAYLANIIHDGDSGKTAARLARYAPICVIAGMEPGVLLADELSELLCLPANGTAFSPARRDKFAMMETIRRAGVRCVDQFTSNEPAAIVDWARRRGTYPVVVKPRSSAATDKVAVCRDASEVRAAAVAVLTSYDICGRANTEALVQGHLAGTEYAVNMVSCQGRRYVTDVWRHRKKLGNSVHPIYDTARLSAADESPVPELVAYVHEVLDALRIRFGPTHADVMMTADGPVLVEVGARVSGNLHPRFHDQCAGGNQAEMTALAYVRPTEFIARYGGGSYRKRRDAMCYFTPTALAGTVTGIDGSVVAAIRGLPTVYDLQVKAAVGSRLRPTVDLWSSTLRIFMCADSGDALARDRARIRELKDKVFVVAGDTPSPRGTPRRSG